jgi:predicted nucleotidyltransferase
MMNMRTTKEFIEIIRSNATELQERFGITYMRLFGSVARGDYHEGSDVDLFVRMPAKLYTHIEAAQFLEELLGCKVDLIQDHKGLRPFFKDQIEKDGIDIFTAA